MYTVYKIFKLNGEEVAKINIERMHLGETYETVDRIKKTYNCKTQDIEIELVCRED